MNQIPKIKNKIRVGITMGDPSGIGPAIIAKALCRLKGLAEFVVIGDKGVFSRLPFPVYHMPQVRLIDLKNVLNKNFLFGRVKAEYGKASIDCLDKALGLIKTREIDCLVTCPISKEAINLAGFNLSGHTEYLAKRTNTRNFLMMLLNKNLKVGLITRHIPLKDVSSRVNKEEIYRAVLLADWALKKLFLTQNPRLVICGLNPHASDNGLIGEEENAIIKPALKGLIKKGINICGPLSADAALLMTKKKKYDAAIAAYHDQALISLKMTDEFSGVNITVGLPFIRTSPLHGTAFDIASFYRMADPCALIEAIKIAVKCTLNLKRA